MNILRWNFVSRGLLGVFALWIAMSGGGCASGAASSPLIPPVSGAAASGTDEMLVVHDVKGGNAPRFGLIAWTETGARYRASGMRGWEGVALPDDLEGVARWPGAADTYVAVESSHYKSANSGRMFLVELERDGEATTVRLVAWMALPSELTPRSQSATEYDQVEGLACYVASDGSTRVVLGERRAGRLIECKVDWTARHCDVIDATRAIGGTLGGVDRRIADLALTDAGNELVLWSVGATDPGNDTGPFRSIVYRAGSVTNGELRLDARDPIEWNLDGLKVEALTWLAPNTGVIGTDDEGLGGIVRKLPPKN